MNLNETKLRGQRFSRLTERPWRSSVSLNPVGDLRDWSRISGKYAGEWPGRIKLRDEIREIDLNEQMKREPPNRTRFLTLVPMSVIEGSQFHSSQCRTSCPDAEVRVDSVSVRVFSNSLAFRLFSKVKECIISAH